MALKLNPTREAYEEFYGRNTDQMPKLIAGGRVPMNVSQLMQRRLDVRNSDDEMKSAYMDNYFGTGDAVVYHPDGRVKVVFDSQHLRDINLDSTIRSGALILSQDVYKTLEGEEFKKGKLGKVENLLSLAEVKDHPVWRILARDQNLLNEYADYILAEGKQRFGYDKAMGVYLDSASDTVKLRSWYVYWLVDGSNAVGRDDLNDHGGRLLGIAPEALSVSATGVSNVKTYTSSDLHAFDKAMTGLEEIVKPEVLKPLTQLRKKL